MCFRICCCIFVCVSFLLQLCATKVLLHCPPFPSSRALHIHSVSYYLFPLCYILPTPTPSSFPSSSTHPIPTPLDVQCHVLRRLLVRLTSRQQQCLIALQGKQAAIHAAKAEQEVHRTFSAIFNPPSTACSKLPLLASVLFLSLQGCGFCALEPLNPKSLVCPLLFYHPQHLLSACQSAQHRLQQAASARLTAARSLARSQADMEAVLVARTKAQVRRGRDILGRLKMTGERERSCAAAFSACTMRTSHPLP